MTQFAKLFRYIFYFSILFFLLVPVASAVSADDYQYTLQQGDASYNLVKQYNGSYVDQINGSVTPFSNFNGPYMRTLTFTSDRTQNNTLINIALFRNNSSIKPDFSDLRVYNSQYIQLPIYVKQYPEPIMYNHIFIKLNVTEGVNTVYLNYGNTSATSVSNISSVYLYYANYSTPTTLPSQIIYNDTFTNSEFLYDTSTSTGSRFSFNSSGNNSFPSVYHRIIGSTGYIYQNLNENGYQSSLMDGFNNSTRVFLNFSMNNDKTAKVSIIKYNKTTNSSIESIYFNSTNSSYMPYERLYYTTGNDLYFQSIKIYNSSNLSNFRIGNQTDVVTPFPFPVSLDIPSGVFSSLNYTNTEYVGLLNFSVYYTPHVLDVRAEDVTTRGTFNISYIPVDQLATYRLQISNTSDFSNILINTTGNQSNINGSGLNARAHINVTDYENLTKGTYYWRIKSAEENNNTVFANGSFVMLETVSFLLRIHDGISGDWINVSIENNTSTDFQYPNGSLGNYPYMDVRYRDSNYSMISSNISIIQGSEIKNYSNNTITINGTNYFARYVDNVSVNSPTTINLTINRGNPNYAQWENQTYTFTLREYMIKDGYLDLSLERITSNNTIASNSTHGIIHASSLEAISNGSVMVNFSSNGTYITTIPFADGGQYAYYNSNNSTAIRPFMFTFLTQGYQTVSGTIGNIKQDVLMIATPTITIKVKDAETNLDVQYFTTFLGEDQLIRSTDNGIVSYENVTEGMYQVIIQATGYAQSTKQINVTDVDKDITLFIKKSQNETTWDEKNFVTFYILDQHGNYVYNSSVSVILLNGTEVYSQTLTNTATFVTELNRSSNYQIRVIKLSENIDQTVNVYGSSLSSIMYLYVNRTVSEAPSLINGTSVTFSQSGNNLIATATTTNPKINNLFFENANASYYNTNTGENGTLPAPSISTRGKTVTATWNLSGHTEAGITVTANVTVKSEETGNQELKARKSFAVKGDSGIIVDLGLTESQMFWVSVTILGLLALITSSAGIPYASTLVPIAGYLLLHWAGWVTFEDGALLLLATGLIIVLYNIIKNSRG
ncbi:MAG: DUF2341 domain-containing protein [Lachnospiraceae bacterium]|nr:DUF2341 domain-containing protein [Lachnospiraceae bacterium]